MTRTFLGLDLWPVTCFKGGLHSHGWRNAHMKSYVRLSTVLGPAALAVGVLSLNPKPADACGGLFCDNVPVVQVGEAVIFTVDKPNNTVQATINITYQGAAQDFAWVLPLQTAPEKVDVGSAQAFQILQRMTIPQFRITEVTQVGICGPDPAFSRGVNDSAS